jgi:hypothetical protein
MCSRALHGNKWRKMYATVIYCFEVGIFLQQHNLRIYYITLVWYNNYENKKTDYISETGTYYNARF